MQKTISVIELRDNTFPNGHELVERNKDPVKKVHGFFQNYCQCLNGKVEPDDANEWTAEKYETNGINGWTTGKLDSEDRFTYKPPRIIPITIDPTM